MLFSFKNSLQSSIKSSLIILKLVVPIYILADIIFYYDLLKYVTFLFEPITSFLNLPPEAALSIVSGMFLNLYAAIAFAAPLTLSPKEWTILAIFLGICHALIVETSIMKKLGISKIYSVLLRVFTGLFVAFISTLIPKSWFTSKVILASNIQTIPHYHSILDLLYNSIYNSIYLSIEIITLISVLIFFLDFIKSLKMVENYSKKINSAFSIAIGIILGITYGAGILINEYEKNTLNQEEILYVGTFLMICHAIIEDTLLFVIFGANLWIIITLRILFAFIFSTIIIKFLTYFTQKLNQRKSIE